MEVCQTGIDEVIPAWCVGFEISPSFILQGLFELIILFVFVWCMYNMFNVMKKRKDRKKEGAKHQINFPPDGWEGLSK